MLLRAAKFTAGYVGLFGQEPASRAGSSGSLKSLGYYFSELVGCSGYTGLGGHCPVSPNFCPSS